MSLREKFYDLRKSFWKVTLEFSNIASTMERFLNLIGWEDATRTWIYLIFLLIACSVVWIVSFRFIILYGVIKKFIKGRTRYKKIYQRNYALVSWTLKYIVKKHFPKDYNLFNIAVDSNSVWPILSVSQKVLGKKIIEQI